MGTTEIERIVQENHYHIKIHPSEIAQKLLPTIWLQSVLNEHQAPGIGFIFDGTINWLVIYASETCHSFRDFYDSEYHHRLITQCDQLAEAGYKESFEENLHKFNLKVCCEKTVENPEKLRPTFFLVKRNEEYLL